MDWLKKRRSQIEYYFVPKIVWRQSQEKKKNAAKKNAEDKSESSNNVTIWPTYTKVS